MRQSTLALLAAHLSVGWVSTGPSTTTCCAFIPYRSFHSQWTQHRPRHRVDTCNGRSRSSGSPLHYDDRQISSHDIDEDKAGSKCLDTIKERQNHIQSLWVFVHNLQRERRDKGLSGKHKNQKQFVSNVATQQKQQQQQQQRMKHPQPAKSLASFLNKNQFILAHPAEQLETQSSHHQLQPQPFRIPANDTEPFSRAVIQAIRLASELGDYKLIATLVQASIQYANQHPIITPRVFGEAIDGLAKTAANTNKLKQIWNWAAAAADSNLTTEPLGTFELNIMIKALASRGKIRAALDLYYQTTGLSITTNDDTTNINNVTGHFEEALHAPHILPDPYTLSSIFTALQDSILDEQATQTWVNPAQSTKQNSQSQPTTQCWQWNEATHMLETYLANQDSFPSLNNHVFSSLLKLSYRVSQVYPPSAHNGPKVALFLLHTMHQLNISPDVVTCTLIISNLGCQWKTALNMLYAMKTASSASSSTSAWRLPLPNVYTYSAVITICAHCHQYQAAMELLQELKQPPQQHQRSSDNCSPNTWVYNAALLATTRSDSMAVVSSELTPKNQKRSRERLLMAMKLLSEMQNSNHHNCNPDTVTFNTVLATLDGIASSTEPQSANDELEQQFSAYFQKGTPRKSGVSFEENVVHRLLDEMESADIPRDSITYRNAILAVRFSDDTRSSVQRILDRALRDKEALWASSSARHNNINHRPPSKARQLDGKAANGVTFVFDTAMTVLSSRGDVEGVLTVFTQLMMHSPEANQKPKSLSDKIFSAQVHLVHALGRSQTGAVAIPIFLNATRGDRIARLALSRQFPKLDETLLRYAPENEALYSASISSCLTANDIENARTVLALMRAEGLKPSDLSLQEIARAYARLAVISSGDEENNQQKEATNCSSLALTRAKNAYSIATKTLPDPPASLLSTVARTCASLGMWTEAYDTLKILHSRMTERRFSGPADGVQVVLPQVHRALLRAASIQGNVTAALSLVDKIQKLLHCLDKSDARQTEDEERLLFQSGNEASTLQRQPVGLGDDNTWESLAMSVEDWKLLLIAASKSGHWRVCVNTLQFLRPFLEETHPSSLGSTVEERSRLYGQLAPALTIALKCLEVRSQYGWAVRAIDDWIDWCGRRPPKEAVIAAIRILSKRGRGREVISLVARCTVDDGALLSYASNDSSYGLVLHVGAITALHNEGLYDDADDAFIAAVRGNFLPFDLHSEEFDGKHRMVLDLHGMNVPVAHSAVRVALQQEVHLASWKVQASELDGSKAADAWDNDMIIVTGLGRNSALQMRPVLRPEVQRMLMEEFYPPLSTVSIPGNMGAVRIPYLDIREWLCHQRREKGSRMLAVASVLRSVASIDRLRQSIVLKIQAEEERSRPGSTKENDD